jgi:hypothetical protein
VDAKTPACELFDAMMAGSSAAELQPFVDQLSSTEHLALLCIVCFIVAELESNCAQRAAELKQVLANCEFFTGSVVCYESCKGKITFESADV